MTADLADLDIERELDELRRGRTTTARLYVSPEMERIERERIWSREWIHVAHRDELAEPGTVLVRELGDIEIVLTRDGEGELHALRNACPHRGARVATGDGRHSALQCSYHGWTFGLDGRLRRARDCDGDALVQPGATAMAPVHVAELGPLVFASAAALPEPFADAVGPLRDLDGVDWSRLHHHDTRAYPYRANWKLAVENSLECYHCPTTHPGLMDVLDIASFRATPVGRGLVTGFAGADRRGTAGRYRLAAEAATGEPDARWPNAFVWPNLWLVVYPGPPNAVVADWRPRGRDRSVCTRSYFFSDDWDREDRDEYVRHVEEVQRQDVEVCESVQRNVDSGNYRRGVLHLLPEGGPVELGVRQFQQNVLAALRANPG